MTFPALLTYRFLLTAMTALIFFSGQPALSQSNNSEPNNSEPNKSRSSKSNSGDLVPRTRVDENAETPPIQGAQYPPLRMTSDKPEVVHLNKPATNIIVPNKDHAIIRPDTRRTLIIQPRQPGATFFRALDKKGDLIMQRHILVGTPKQDYVHIRRSCDADDEGCERESTYYCPGRCYTVNVQQPGSQSGGGNVAPIGPRSTSAGSGSASGQ